MLVASVIVEPASGCSIVQSSRNGTKQTYQVVYGFMGYVSDF